jgi:DNA-binding NtrC family response regulator
MATVMVLDDESDACELVERILSPKHVVKTFTEEDAAVNYVKTNDVDLVILDIKLKKMSGVDVLSDLRRIRPKLRAIMLTGYPTVKSAESSITLGAYEYLTKPLDIEVLERKVDQVLAASSKEPQDEKAPALAEDLSPSE